MYEGEKGAIELCDEFVLKNQNLFSLGEFLIICISIVNISISD